MNGKPVGNGGNGITLKQVLAVAGTLLLVLVVGLVTMLLQGDKTQQGAIQVLRQDTTVAIQKLQLDVKQLEGWKENWKPQVDAVMLTTQTLDKGVAALNWQLAEMTKAMQDLLGAVRTQQADTEKQARLAIQFQATLDRIESQGKRR